MKTVQNSIVKQHFEQKLPAGLIPNPVTPKDTDPKRYKAEGDLGGNPKNGKKKRQKLIKQEEDDNDKKVQNPNKQFLLEKGESFSDKFYKNKHLAPKENGVNVCLSFWIRGYCNEGCPRLHANISTATETALAEFVANCRSEKVQKKKGLDFGDRAGEEDAE
jgi:hypothetical protein